MSTKRGKPTRNRPQKYQNRVAFKNDLHDSSVQIKKINAIHVCEVCEHCKAVIEWKIKYKKYKPLKQPKTCIKCQQKNVKKAYHVVCRDCAVKERICSKCLKSADQINIEPPKPTEEEQLKLKTEMDRLIKSLSERKRRTFLRYMAKGKGKGNDILPEEGEEKANDSGTSDKKEDTNETNGKVNTRVPHTREDLLKKIEELKLAEDDNDDDDFDLEDSDLEDFSDEDCSY